MKEKDLFVRFFLRAMARFMECGIPLDRGLRSLIRQEEKPWAKRMLSRIQRRICRGISLSDALGKEPRFFPRLTHGLIVVGEQTGTISSCLDRAAGFLEKEAEIKLKMRSALFYPMILLLITAGGTIGLVKGFIPLFLPLLNSASGTLPFATRVLLAVSRFVSFSWPWIPAAAAVGMLGAFAIWRRERIRKKIEIMPLRFPALGTAFKRGMGARVAWVLATAHSAGIPFTKTLTILEETFHQQTYREFLQKCRLAVAQGEPASRAFLAARELFPPLLGHLLAVAEQTGRVEGVMIRCAEVLEEEMDCLFQRFARLAEPVILALMGSVVTAIMISVFLPVYSAFQGLA